MSQDFEAAKRKVIGIDRQRLGIGTYGEKTVHAIFKYYYEPDEDKHEIPIDRYVADIYTGSEIIEIQTRNFDQVRKKLDRFLPQYPVTVVLPIPDTKWLIWIDEETGELTTPRKSPKKGNEYGAFKELYKIKTYLKKEGLTIVLLFLDMEEYRLLNGWSHDKKKGSTRYDRIPIRITKEVRLENVVDYQMLIPNSLKGEFTCAEFAKAVKINNRQANLVLNVLFYLDVVKRIGKRGRAFVYEKVINN